MSSLLLLCVAFTSRRTSFARCLLYSSSRILRDEYWVHHSAVCQTNCFSPTIEYIDLLFYIMVDAFMGNAFENIYWKSRRWRKKPVCVDRFYYYLCTVQCSLFNVRCGNQWIFIFCRERLPYRQYPDTYEFARQPLCSLCFASIFFGRKKSSFAKNLDFCVNCSLKAFHWKFQEFCVAPNKSVRFVEHAQWWSTAFSAFLRHNFVAFDWSQPPIYNSPIEDWTLNNLISIPISYIFSFRMNNFRYPNNFVVARHDSWRSDGQTQNRLKKIMWKRKKKKLGRSLCVPASTNTNVKFSIYFSAKETI